MATTCTSQAGQIRKLELTEDHPGTVVLALGRTTAISFLSRPEKVVPGSPQSIQINFLGSDLTVTPVSRKPGNLLVYTKSGRYVILFTIGNETHYDDVVRVGTHGRGRPLRLLTDSFTLASFKAIARRRGGGALAEVPKEITLRLVTHGREIAGPDLDDLLDRISAADGVTAAGHAPPKGPKVPIRCTGCLVRLSPAGARISCVAPIEKIHCDTKAVSVDLERRTP